MNPDAFVHFSVEIGISIVLMDPPFLILHTSYFGDT